MTNLLTKALIFTIFVLLLFISGLMYMSPVGLQRKIDSCYKKQFHNKQLEIDKKYLCNNIRCVNALINERVLLCLQGIDQ